MVTPPMTCTIAVHERGLQPVAGGSGPPEHG